MSFLTAGIAQLLRNSGVEVVLFTPVERNVDIGVHTKEHPRHKQAWRHVMYGWIAGHREGGRVFATDTKDVIFQADPFAPDILSLAPTSDLWVFQDGLDLLEFSTFNNDWVRVLGLDVFDRIKHRPVLNSGVIYTTVQGLQDISAAMEISFTKASVIDQGHFQVQVWDGYLDHLNATVFYYPDGPAANLGTIPPEQVNMSHTDDGGVVVTNRQGRPIPAIHQWNAQKFALFHDAIIDYWTTN